MVTASVVYIYGMVSYLFEDAKIKKNFFKVLEKFIETCFAIQKCISVKKDIYIYIKNQQPIGY